MVSFIRHIRALLCALCLLVCASAQAANVYPISLTASLLPPYSNCLGDYMSGSMDRVNVMAVMSLVVPLPMSTATSHRSRSPEPASLT